MTDTLELLPKEQVVIELLESITPSREVIDRCKDLKCKGFTLALDDHLYDPSFAPLYELVDIIKIDLLQPTLLPLDQVVKLLRKWPLLLLAEKVESHEQFNYCRELGFEMFQGYYFAKPMVIQQKMVNIGSMTLMRLMDQVMRDAEVAEIEETFKQNPELIYNLLRLVNSVYMGMREKIKALRHAIAILGRQHLKRWIMLSIYATSDKGTTTSPLMEMAAVRGKLMEILVTKQSLVPASGDIADRAFMTGVLSLIDVLFNVTMDDVIKQCNLSDDVRGALMERSGLMGNLLLIAEHQGQVDYDELALLLAEINLSAADFSAAQLEAIKWANQISASD
jgi:EAL and modified HD-GYP domain-containing signal transduction protein